MSSKGVVFLCFGDKHNGHMCVAFNSLRKHWKGEVAIICDPANVQFMQRYVDEDPLKKTQLVVFDPFGRRSHGSGAGYLNKAKLIELMPFMHSVFLDCDTCVVGDFEAMFPADVEVRLTQFSDWVTTGKKMQKRIGHWLEVMPAEAALHMAVDYPAINTGVMGLSKLSKKLAKRWFDVTESNVRFMCDELAMQLIFLQYPHAVFPDYFNCSPIYSPGRAGFEEDKVAIWHGHGFKSIRSPKGLSIWLPQLLELWHDNTYGVREAFAANKYFTRLAADPIEFVRQYGKNHAEELIQTNEITEQAFAI